jgi:DNA-binding PadR family transcriptional regulator
MSQGVDPRFEGELRRGLVQLAALAFLGVPRYGYDLVRLLGSAGIAVEEGTLYPILRRFEEQGVLTARWETGGARPRKYYVLSEEGRRVRDAMQEAWARVREATDDALAAAEEAARRESAHTEEKP